MSENSLHEISRRSIPIQKNEETFISWQNSCLAVRTDKGVHFFEFSYNLHCLDKNIDCIESSIDTPKVSPATSSFPKGFLKSNEIPNSEFTQMLVDPAFWPHKNHLVQELANVIDFKWSPTDLRLNAIAVLNNVGNVEIYASHRYRWINILNLSTIIKDLYISNLNEQDFDLSQVKQAVYSVETSSICWEPQVNINNTCHFVTAQKNGSVMFWLMQCEGDNMKVFYQNSCRNNNKAEIMSMLWIPRLKSQFWLICSNILGEMYAYICEVENDSINHVSTVDIWPHKDRMIAKYEQYIIFEDKVVLIYNKHRHLVVQMFALDCNLITQYVINVNDYRIMSITQNNNNIYLTTVNCKIYKIDINILDNDLNVNIVLIETKDDFSTYELYGLGHSTNGAICALAIIDRKVSVRKHPAKIDVVFLCKNIGQHTEVQLLLNNPSQKLTHHWDYIELLRYKTMKLKVLPTVDFNQLYADDSCAYKLKIYLILLILYNNLDIILKKNSKLKLPETSKDKVQGKILVLHAKTLLQELNDSYNNNDGVITHFEKEIFAGARMYLEGYFKKDINDIFPIKVQTGVEYTCVWCGHMMEEYVCNRGHLNTFCAVTFTPMGRDDYIICKSCSATARIELYEDRPMCPFCDLYLSDCYLPS